MVETRVLLSGLWIALMRSLSRRPCQRVGAGSAGGHCVRQMTRASDKV